MLTLRHTLYALAVALATALLAATPAPAAVITFDGPADGTAAGFGSLPPVLTVKPHGNATEEYGSVAWDGSADVLSGDADLQHSQTVSVADLLAAGVTQSHFGIIFNINEDGDKKLLFRGMSLVVYSSAGAALFSAPYVGSDIELDATDVGVGQGGFGHLFRVHVNTSEWDTYFGNLSAATNRVGITVLAGQSIQDVGAGAESFTVSLPEPGTLVLLALGSAGLLARRRLAR